ncbi:chorismate synthase, partial [Streptococcus pyogenes]
ATVERSDPTALPAAGVIMENVVATVLVQEILETFSSDTMLDLEKAFSDYRSYVKQF